MTKVNPKDKAWMLGPSSSGTAYTDVDFRTTYHAEVVPTRQVTMPPAFTSGVLWRISITMGPFHRWFLSTSAEDVRQIRQFLQTQAEQRRLKNAERTRNARARKVRERAEHVS